MADESALKGKKKLLKTNISIVIEAGKILT